MWRRTPDGTHASGVLFMKARRRRAYLLYFGTGSLNPGTILTLLGSWYTRSRMRNSAPGQRLRQSEKTNVARTKSLISVVDDDRSMSRMLYRVITAAGLDVVSFASAEEFLDSGALGDSACLILDMHLPGMSGIELQQHLNASGLEIPIIFISAQADEAAKRQVLEAGAAGFFNKPFSIESLLATVRSIPSLALT